MRRIICLVMIIGMVVVTLTSCAKKWTCDVCGKTWSGTAYYMAYGGPNSTLCEDCAWAYYNPFPYSNYVKK